MTRTNSVSVKDVAQRAGVSVGTVSNVLNRPERVADETTVRVREAIKDLGFVRNDAARLLRAGRSSTIGMIVFDMGNPFFSQVITAASARAHSAHLTIIVGHSNQDTARELHYLDLFEEQRVLGILVSPVGNDLRPLERLRARGMRVVLVDRDDSEGTLPSVAVDDVNGGHLATAHLLAQGARHICFVGGPRNLSQVRDRFAGAEQAIAAVEGARLTVHETPHMSVEAGRTIARRILAMRAELRPDAIFAANDIVAIGMLETLLTGGVRVPADIRLIGYDDIDFAATSIVPLSSIRQPSELLGEAAVELLLAQPGADVDHSTLQPELVIRASTG